MMVFHIGFYQVIWGNMSPWSSYLFYRDVVLCYFDNDVSWLVQVETLL